MGRSVRRRGRRYHGDPRGSQRWGWLTFAPKGKDQPHHNNSHSSNPGYPFPGRDCPGQGRNRWRCSLSLRGRLGIRHGSCGLFFGNRSRHLNGINTTRCLLERRSQRPCTGEAILWLTGQRLEDHSLNHFGNVRVKGPWQRLRGPLEHNSHGSLGVVGYPPGQHLEQDDAQGVDVGPVIALCIGIRYNKC